MTKIKCRLRRQDGTPLRFESVLAIAVNKISRASEAGNGAYLSAEEIRALDWAVIREDGGVDTEGFRDHHFGDR